MSAGRRSGMKAMALRVEALEALVVRYWCGDGPVGAGAIADIRSQVEALPGA